MTVTVTGNLQASTNATPTQGSIEVMLCGYGSRVPRINGVALVARITTYTIAVDAAGAFTFTVAPNDDIAPAGTYYTVVVKDENGDAAQINAYRFTSNQSSYDLNLIDPYDPNQPPPPLPPLITNLLQIVVPADGMVFDGSLYISFKTTLPGNVTQPVFQNMIPGNLYTFIIVQDGVGNHDFTWATNVKNAAYVSHLANATTVQTFVADEFENLYAIGPGTYYP